MSRDPAKGALFAQCVKELSLQDLIDVMLLKATLEGAMVRVKVTHPRPKKAASCPDPGVKGWDY